MNLNDYFLTSFIKTALTVQRPATPPTIKSPAPSLTPPTGAQLNTLNKGFGPVNASNSSNPLTSIQKQPLPTSSPPQYQGWKLKGYSTSGNTGVYSYADPQGKYHVEDHQLSDGAQSVNDFNDQNEIQSYNPKPASITQAEENQALSSAMNNPAKTIWNEIGSNLNDNTVQGLASKLKNDSFAGNALPELNPIVRNQTQVLEPSQMSAQLEHNVMNNQSLFNQLHNISPQLPDELGSSDSGIREQGLRQLLQMFNSIAQSNPQMAQELYQKYFHKQMQ